jgi:hypothetical protein
MANRVFYASQGVKIGNTVVQGAQSVGVQSNFTLEQAFQLGRLEIYNNAVTNPEVTVTISKVLDGYATIYNLATGGGTLISNEADRCDIIVAVGSDTNQTLDGTQAVKMTGMYLSSLSYTMPVDGFMTEEVSFIGDNKVFTTTAGDLFDGPSDSGQVVLRRQSFNLDDSDLPAEVDGQNITNVTINADLGREAMFKLGQFGPFHRFTNFPLEVTCEFEVSATGLDTVDVNQNVTCNTDDFPAEEQITIVLCDPNTGSTGYTFDLGSKNRLTSVNYQGGDTGGGNATITYSYSTYNELTITE